MFLHRRNKIYYLHYLHEDGRRLKVSTHSSTKAGAYTFIQSFKRTLTQDGKRKKLISEFIPEVESYVASTHAKSTAYLFKRCLLNLINVVGDVALRDLSAQSYDFYVAGRLKTVTAVSVNAEARTLRTALNIALRWKLLDSNPFAGLPLPRMPEPVPAFFTVQEFEKMIGVVKEDWLKDVLTFTVLTGLRRGEVVNLQWPQVDLERKLIIVQSTATFKTKAGKKRSVPLGEMAYQILDRRRISFPDTEYVFTRRGKKLSPPWLSHKLKKYVRKLSLDENLNFHALRHTFASWLVQKSASLYEVQKLLGHADISTTQIYSHLAPETLHLTVNKLQLHLGEEKPNEPVDGSLPPPVAKSSTTGR
ncbi:MAG: tyrosine-type recombinase/integrase [Ignavibacteriales bacterium]|nr:tyrosine-type recombinase/integrase [Ignavibacteriales bacterium]